MVAVAVRLRPSPVTVLAAGCVAGSMPDSPSSPTHVTVTSPRYQPAWLPPAGTPARVGLVLSMLMPVTSALLRLPATSTASPRTDWPAPSLVSVVSPAQPATPVCRPDPRSSQLNLTSTSVLFQPKPFAAGVAVPEMDGATVSTLTSNVRSASSFPARSTLQYETVCVPVDRSAVNGSP